MGGSESHHDEDVYEEHHEYVEEHH